MSSVRINGMLPGPSLVREPVFVVSYSSGHKCCTVTYNLPGVILGGMAVSFLFFLSQNTHPS